MNTTKQQVSEEEEIPFLSVGAHELDNNMDVEDSITCPHCGLTHEITYGTDEAGNVTNMLAFYKCTKTGKSYIAGIDGKLL